MYKFILIIIVITGTVFYSLAQSKKGRPYKNTKTTSKKLIVSKKKLPKTEEPIIYDTDGKRISPDEAKKLLQDYDYLPEDIYKDGKPVASKLIKNEMVGKLSPDFLVTTIDGKQITLSQQKGKITVLNFWFIACKPCLLEMPALNKIVDKYKDSSRIDFIAVNYGDGSVDVKSFLEKREFKFQIVTDSRTILDIFKIRMYPQTIVLDKEGKIILWRIYLGENTESLNKLVEDELNK